ncbi:hypothetical protein K469DRAFT_686852 [Zopfia rhizophila CBS 207.26]|uniref:Peptidase C14 caspase domain-containing protein n=1 Tax=Zopfia rhizophila CBS 207.26 TaxID=1314779 RepID=A0A6A6E6Q6_9PEZI|nr:hypothetical protein K469DRAFT_686852 [Zopfia rhizophila CBS 207.26]
MAPAVQPRGKMPSSTDTLQVETKCDDCTAQPEAQNDALTPTPVTPEVVRFHERHVHEFRKTFDENMQNKPVKHDQVFVLLLSWADELDDLKVEPEVKKLQQLFTTQYGFEVTWEKLDHKRPQQQLNFYLASFILNHDSRNTLLIIYYAGHGSYRDNGVHLHASTAQQTENERQRNSIAWSGAENNITGTKADVLVIFDCCEAGGFGGYKMRSSKPNFEFIAACGVKEKAVRPGKKSFTSALMWALEKLRHEHPFTSISLVEKIRTYPHRPKGQNPELLRRDEFADGLVWIAPLNVHSPESESAPKSERRDPKHEYLDLRFNFYRRVEIEDAKNLARHLSRLVNHEETFGAKHITLLDKASILSKAIANFRRGSSYNKRKRSASSISGTLFSSQTIYSQEVITEPMEIPPPEAKRPRFIQPLSVSAPTSSTSPQPQGASYHFRMFLDCSLQSATSQIGRFADWVRPTAQARDETAPNNEEQVNL